MGKMTKELMTVMVSLSVVLLLTACGSSSSDKDSSSKSTSTSQTAKKKAAEKKDDVVTIMNNLAASGKSTKELYVTGKIKVGKSKTIVPGIYNLQVTGGSGNIMGERKDLYSMPINWVGAAKGTDSTDPSSIRVILLEGDMLEFSDISKIKLDAVPEKVTESNQLGIGNYVVGRDIKAGTYKLSTNMKMDSEYGNLGWSLEIYNDATGDSKDQSYNPDNQDVAVKLTDGEIVTTSFDNTQDGVSSDTARLIFTAVNQ